MGDPLIAPASYAQERIWLDSQVGPETPLYTIVTGTDLPGDCSPEDIRRWLSVVVERHEALRTGLTLGDGELQQVVLRQVEVPPLPLTDLTGLPAQQRRQRLAEARQEEFRRPFQLDAPPLWRARLLRLDTGWHLLFAVHHVVFDGESVVLFVNELTELAAAHREGRPPRLPELDIQYADFAAWQRDLVNTEIGQEQLAYWRHRLADLPEVHALPLDHPRPEQSSNPGEDVSFALPDGRLEQVRELARRQSATEQAVLLAAYLTVLARASGSTDLVVGVPAQGRDRAELRSLIGMFVNTLVIRVDAAGDPTFAELVGRVRDRLFEAWDNQDIPLQLLMRVLAPPRRPGYRPLFQLAFNHLKGVTAVGGLGLAADELMLVCAGEQARLTYRTDLFTRDTADKLVAGYLRVLEQVVTDPDLRLSQLEVPPIADSSQGALDPVPAADSLPVPAAPAPVSGQQRFPLSFGQERLWVLERLAPGDPVYNMPMAIRLRGSLDVAALRRSLDGVIARHSTLRTTFTELDGEPFQLVSPPAPGSLPVEDLTHLPEAERASAARQAVAAEARIPFDLTTGPLLRAKLVRLTADDHFLLLTMHHIVADGWSIGVLINELSEGYRAAVAGQEPNLPELPVSYGDFAVWQRRQLDDGELAHQMEYWIEHLTGAPALLELPTERPRPAEETFDGDQYRFALPSDLTEGLGRVASAAEATPFMVLLAVLQVALARYSGQRDIVVGTPVAGRSEPSVEPLIGLFTNTLALRGQLSEDMTFRQLLAQARETVLNGLSYQDVPFEKLVEVLRPERSLSHSPIFQVQLIVQNTPSVPLRLPGLAITPESQHSRTAKFDLTMEVHLPPGEPARVWLEYKRDLFSREWAERFGESLTAVLRSVVDDPDVPVFDIELLSPRQRVEVLSEPNQTDAPVPTGCVRDALLAGLTTGSARVVAGGVEVPGTVLVDRSARLATVLRQHGVGPDTMVGLCLDRSEAMLVGVLGAWQAGGGYVPLDPAFPPDRLRMMVEDSGLPVIVTCATERELAASLAGDGVTVVCLDDPEVTAATPLSQPVPLHPDNLAYAIYTSGSTGRPKGVQVPHGPVANLLYWFADALALSSDDTLVAVTTLSFDISVLELLLPLLVGCRMVIADQEQSADPRQLRRLLDDYRATVLQATPATWRMLLSDGPLSNGLRVRLCGGEPLPRELADELVADGVDLWNVYGPTETTVWSAAGRVTAGGGMIVVGPPLGNTSLYVLDRRLLPVPVGVVGEVFIGGLGLARGYHARPDLTADRFLPDPFSDRAGARMYRTGDLARRLPDGTLEFLGRADNQVKIRGFRIETGEIEAALVDHPTVTQAVVVADTGAGEARLVGYVVPAASGATPAELWPQLREHLRQRLPEYMLPATLVTLSELPLTPNGKVDRRALPAPSWGATDATEYVAPRTEVEQQLVQLWTELLGVDDPIGVHDDFFSLGGHSLAAARLLARIRSTFGSQLLLRDVFAGPTVAELARVVVAHPDYGRQVSRPLAPASAPTPTTAPAGSDPVPTRPTSLTDLSDGDIERLLAAAMREREARQAQVGPRRYPLSSFQRRLWFLHQLAPDEPTYTLPQVWPLPGAVDPELVRRAWDALVARHSSLRTTFPPVDGEPVQQVAPPHPVALTVVDLSGEPEDQRIAAARRVAEEEFRRPFDLAEGPLLRVMLVRLRPDEHLVLANMHHLIADATSLRILWHEFQRLYREYRTGVAADLPPLPIEYGQYAAHQAETLDERRTQQQLDYWVAKLRGAPALLELPTDRPRPAVQTFRGASYRTGLSSELTSAVLGFARQEQTTPYVVLLAAFQLLLARYSGQSDVVVGTPVTVRSSPELEHMVGLFVNTVVSRADLSGDPTLAELVAAARADTLAALDHVDVPFERVAEVLQPERSASYNPVFQVMFVLNQGPEPVSATDLSAGMKLAAAASPGLPVARFDLTLAAEIEGSRVWLSFDYNADLFDESTMARMAEHLAELLRVMTTEPEQRAWQVPLTAGAGSAEERAIVRSYPQQLVHELVAEAAAADPDAPAVLTGDRQLTYGELEQRANRLAWRLHRLGVAADQPVALGLPAGPEAMVGLLGILRAGGAYLPIDPAHPQQRRDWLVADAGAKVLVTSTGYADQFRDHPGTVVYLEEDESGAELPSEPPPVEVHPLQAAYIIYTSGSTGTPKGVVVPHAAVANLTQAFIDIHGFHAADRLLMLPPLSFDASVGDIFPALAAGAALLTHPEPAGLSGRELLRFCAEQGITVVDAPAALWQQWVDDLAEVEWPDDHPLVQMMVGGDVVPMEKVRAWARVTGAQVDLVNHYGPTEATVCATTYITVDGTELGEGTRLPVGAPVPNLRCYVLDRNGRPVPDGVAGEVYLGGAGVTRGYLGRPGLTAERFLPDPFSDQPGARMYRTGDRARWGSNGQLEFLGRVDDQVKIRGHRVELREVEAAITAHPHVREAAVVARPDHSGQLLLVGYVVATADSPLEVSDLRTHLRQQLPDYLVPSRLVRLESLPLTSHGKVDRAALPEPDEETDRPEHQPPVTATEQAVARVWAEVLGLTRPVGRQDNFFELGGHSLQAVAVLSGIEKELDYAPPLRILFQAETLAELAAALDEARGVPSAAVTGGGGVDLRAEAVLPDDVCVNLPAWQPGPLERVLLTGATGFLGAFLLNDLLQHTTAAVYCLVRADSLSAGAERIEQNLRKYELWRPEYAERILPRLGDLSAPRLGLDSDTFTTLAAEVDAIYHNGGAVNFLYAYDRLRDANVAGTIEVLRLAGTTRPTPVHFVSTLGVFMGDHYRGGRVTEADLPSEPEGLPDGYNQSKWVADALVRHAAERGLPVTIHRPARVTGHSRTGVANADDYFSRLLKTFTQLGSVPLLQGKLDMFPVDALAATIGRVTRDPEAFGGGFHYYNNATLSYDDVAAALRRAGFRIRRLPYPQWRAQLLERVESGEDIALSMYAPLFPAELSPIDPARAEPEWDCTRSQQYAELAGAPCPPADVALLVRYLNYFRRTGYLEGRPARRGAAHV